MLLAKMGFLGSVGLLAVIAVGLSLVYYIRSKKMM